ncbi:type II 3-dehydroquinate dehydratase [Halanaerobium salsuginis]|uniref:3-dehydroquinate dehydratase n=1 Tax=Halanaerobium salsuginis TaxID=29563 RepID=A0A1I4EVR9_9FIRM|nr:type II 3-dehydroquinate dehydratase [Halanaerobium salsuginis]SFL09200.1 3-dehydroquinate dehydratase [Halanaerobium salsuginis]
MQRVAVIHGPNLNLLGLREPEIYGTTDLATLNNDLAAKAAELNLELDIMQSNHEGEIIDYLHNNFKSLAGIVINPAGLSLTSVVLRDALAAVRLPAIEVHIDNIYKKDDFRQKSITAAATVGQITGLGAFGYLLALEAVADILRREKY